MDLLILKQGYFNRQTATAAPYCAGKKKQNPGAHVSKCILTGSKAANVFFNPTLNQDKVHRT